MMSIIDLSATLDVVNDKLLLKILKSVGLPSDVTDLIQLWLSNSIYYVNIDGNCSMYYSIELGAI